MKINSHTLVFEDFESHWYKKWAKQLNQNAQHLDGHKLKANKFWQNAVIAQSLFERKVLREGSRGIGFGVGHERLPALFAKLGVKTTATDQPLTNQNAKHWSRLELATGLKSLNHLNICEPELFAKNVEYLPLDMTKIPPKLFGHYDFLWSNCALGHLGSIQAGLDFIEKSLNSLKPGGVAVHTTELNIISDEVTVDRGNTVIFRLRDISQLMKELTLRGYICSPLRICLGRKSEDLRISMQPKFGNDFSKIQVGGYIATQAVLIIRRPKHQKMLSLVQKLQLLRLDRAYARSIDEMKRLPLLSEGAREALESKAAGPEALSLKPMRQKLEIKLINPKPKEIFIEYKNSSPVSIYSYNGYLVGAEPLLLATDHPKNRKSIFADETWFMSSDDRPSSSLYKKNVKGEYRIVDHVSPGGHLAFKVRFSPKKAKKGRYTEKFSVVQEGVQWIKGTEVEVSVHVV